MSSYRSEPTLNDNDQVEIETPENIVIKYRIAGLGERLNAHILDSLLMGLILMLLVFIFAIGANSFEIDDAGLSELPDEEVAGAVLALLTVLMGFGSFLYFGLQEWLMSGRTLGKRSAKIRVVKDNGFKLNFLSILIRNIFRVVDHVPPFAFVPLFNRRHRRLGDYVAGTIVVMESISELSGLRADLLSIPLTNRAFRFDQNNLKHLTPRDYEVVETLLGRLPSLPLEKRELILQSACRSLCKRMELDMPPEAAMETFLRDLLMTEYHRQNRQMG